MEWNFRNDLPIYSQLIERIRLEIVSGALRPGERLPSVRDMAMEAGVNPNTMQRAMQELERAGMVYSVRTAGRFVTEDVSVISAVRRTIAAEQIRTFLSSMRLLGIEREEAWKLLEESMKEEEQHGSAGM